LLSNNDKNFFHRAARATRGLCCVTGTLEHLVVGSLFCFLTLVTLLAVDEWIDAEVDRLSAYNTGFHFRWISSIVVSDPLLSSRISLDSDQNEQDSGSDNTIHLIFA